MSSTALHPQLQRSASCPNFGKHIVKENGNPITRSPQESKFFCREHTNKPLSNLPSTADSERKGPAVVPLNRVASCPNLGLAQSKPAVPRSFETCAQSIDPAHVDTLKKYIQEFKFQNGQIPPYLDSGNLQKTDLESLRHLEEFAQSKPSEKSDKVRIIIKTVRCDFLSKLNQELYNYRRALRQKASKDLEPSEPKKSNTAIKLKKATAWGTIIGGISLGFINNFIGLSAMVAQIGLLAGTTLITPVVSTIAATFSFVECAIFANFEARIILTSMGIQSKNSCIQLLELDKKEMILLTRLKGQINLFDAEQIKTGDLKTTCFKEISHISKLKKDCYKAEPPKESCLKKWVRRGITFFGGIMTVASGYFSMSSLIVAIGAPFLLGTPVGWIIITSGIVLSLILFLCIRAKGLTSLFYPEIELYKNLRNEVQEFARNNKDLKSYRQANPDQLPNS